MTNIRAGEAIQGKYVLNGRKSCHGLLVWKRPRRRIVWIYLYISIFDFYICIYILLIYIFTYLDLYNVYTHVGVEIYFCLICILV